MVEQAEPAALEAAVASVPVTGGSRLAEAFSSLTIPNFRFLLGGTAASSFAMWMQQIGQGWLVAELTNSPFQLGLVQFLRGISVLLVSPFAGALSERIERRWLAGLASTVNGLAALAIAILIITGHIAMWELYVTSLIGGVCSSVYNPVRQFLVFDAVGPKQLSNAIALNAMVNNMARVVGPGIAGFLIAYSTSSAFFGVFIFLMAATLSLVPMRLDQESAPQGEAILTSIRLGAEYLRRHRTLLRLTLLQAIPSMLIFPYLQMVPLMAKNYLHVGAAGYGWLQTGVGIGSVVSALVVAAFANVRNRGAIASVALLMYMTMILSFSFSRHYVLSFFLLIMGGTGLVVFSTFNQTLLQLHVEDDYRGRVLSLYTMSQGLNPFGALAMGFVASQFLGTAHTIAAFCLLALLLAAVSGVASKEIRSL
jgi:MFS family permease